VGIIFPARYFVFRRRLCCFFQLLTHAGAPQRGRELGQLGIIPDGAVLYREGKIIAVGTTTNLCRSYPHEEALDTMGLVVMSDD
jgi:imidazolonepropionase-like amidohydrolase